MFAVFMQKKSEVGMKYGLLSGHKYIALQVNYNPVI